MGTKKYNQVREKITFSFSSKNLKDIIEETTHLTITRETLRKYN